MMSEGASPSIPIYLDGVKISPTTENFADLPENARVYVELLEKLMSARIGYISVGPGRKQTFMK